ncbi:MAG: stage IV sporulation protein A [Syntrophomonadaceae bacterium]|nr:stage IV sporulation protein A [Syntrophomonadaceae bacterium]
MDRMNIFQDIAERTGGDIYLGVVGPVRTGKSTFIRKFMELMVIPNIEHPADQERARDELPQGAAGRTIMTAEPKFVPAEAVDIVIRDGVNARVRMADCVGYSVPGALGYEEDEGPRMVMTPWFEEAIPFQEAAEYGTRKVITDHSTVGLVVLTDGTITDISRENYLESEERVIQELKELNKPFVVLLNSVQPFTQETGELVQELEARYNVPVLPVNCLSLTREDILRILEEALYEFPVREVNINLPRWIEELELQHWLRVQFEEAVRDSLEDVQRLRDIDGSIDRLAQKDIVLDVTLQEMNLATGVATIDVLEQEDLFFQIMEEISGFRLEGDHDLFRLVKEFSLAKKEYDKVSQALREVRETGYGIVTPQLDEMQLDDPEMIKQGGRYGVRLRAKAPSLHIIRADIATEVTPIIGTEKQCEDMVRYMLDEFQDDPMKIWQTNIFGKTLSDLVREGIQSKVYRMPDNARGKLQDTLQRIVNEGSGGLICIII